MAISEQTPAFAGRHLDGKKVAKDLLVTALLATGIFGSTIAFKTVTAAGGLALVTRFDVAFYVIAAVVIGRLLLWLVFWSKPAGPQKSFLPESLKAGYQSMLLKIGKGFAPTMLLFALIFPFLPFTDRYLLDLGILVLTYVMLGWGLNIVVGLAGLLDLGYVAFYAIGAYSYALLAQYFGFSFWMCLPLAGILAAFWGIILGFPVLRLRGDYLAIVTLAFGEIIRIVLLNWYQFTGGPDGISGIPRPSFFGITFKRGVEGNFADVFGLDYSTIHRIMFLYFLILALALVTNFVTNRLRRLPIGRAWEALREDEIACRSLGLNTTSVKLTAFAIGAMFAGFAGSFFATRQGFISPESFTFIESALILAIVVLGGMGSQIGVVIASIAMIGGFEVFREAEQYRMLIFGFAMVFIMIWRPRGLISTRIPSIFLKEKKKVSSDMVGQGEGH
ncbi:MAG: high-affinity branched-chain amino acid ABC transporter permease LivM [Sneathiella sp.]|uniref:high-affinity branched-chain amino acid ABC transporter permease LivM n=1 Tax=Sneathiella sp. TaxID=1964365 RepID=UPI0030014590